MPKPQVESLLNTTAAVRFDHVLAMTPEQSVALRKGVRGQEGRLTDCMTPLQKETLLALSGTNRMMLSEVDGSRLLTDIYSERQLEAVDDRFLAQPFQCLRPQESGHARAAPGVRGDDSAACAGTI